MSNTGDAMDPDNPGMHTTATIDYGNCFFQVKITLELDTGSVDLKVGGHCCPSVQQPTPGAIIQHNPAPCFLCSFPAPTTQEGTDFFLKD